MGERRAAENTPKLEAWSHVYYGKLPYVIGGWYMFGKAVSVAVALSNGRSKKIDHVAISLIYNLRVPAHVVQLLHSLIRMHCLLHKLQEELGEYTCLKLDETNNRDYGGRVIFSPYRVKKKIPKLDNQKLEMKESMYGLIRKSMNLIQKESIRNKREQTILVPYPFGDPMLEPVDWKDLENATHHMLHGLADLHQAGFTHRDLKWVNCVKINVAVQSKYVIIIDLEDVGRDKEEWGCGPLRDWDEIMLEESTGKNKVKYAPPDQTSTNLES